MIMMVASSSLWWPATSVVVLRASRTRECQTHRQRRTHPECVSRARPGIRMSLSPSGSSWASHLGTHSFACSQVSPHTRSTTRANSAKSTRFAGQIQPLLMLSGGADKPRCQLSSLSLINPLQKTTSGTLCQRARRCPRTQHRMQNNDSSPFPPELCGGRSPLDALSFSPMVARLPFASARRLEIVPQPPRGAQTERHHS